MLEESENIPAVEFSDDLTGLEDCLDLVYGGSVEIREDNFKTIYKFGKLFQIREMMESVLSFRTITKILFDTSIHTVTSTDTSSQPSTSSTFFTSPSISKETSQPLPLPLPPASSSTSTSQLIPNRKKESKRMGLPRPGELRQKLNYDTVTNIDTSSQTTFSSTFISQLIPTYGSFTVKDLNLERVKQLTSRTTSYDVIKDFTTHAGTGIHPCVVVEIVLKW